MLIKLAIDPKLVSVLNRHEIFSTTLQNDVNTSIERANIWSTVYNFSKCETS